MTRLPPDSLTIQTLRIRATDAERMEGDVARLRQDIEIADWPRAVGQSWVFIRQLQAKAPRDQLLQELLQQAREQLAGSDSDKLMRFADLGELLATLLIDLMQGVAATRWYWKRWEQLFEMPTAQAISHLLTEHIAYLPDVCRQLARRHLLQQVWQTIDAQRAMQLSYAVANRSGFALPEWAAIQQQQRLVVEQPDMFPLLPDVPQLRIDWQTLLQQLPEDDVRYRLALLVIGQQLAPLMLQQAPAKLLAVLSLSYGLEKINSAAIATVPSSPPVSAKSSHLSGGKWLKAEIRNETEIAGKKQHSLPQPQTGAATSRKSAGMLTSNEDSHIPNQSVTADSVSCKSTVEGEGHFSPAQKINVLSIDQQKLTLQKTREIDPDFDQLQTEQGGLLYLLNVLNRDEAQQLMADHWRQLPNGWGWLYRLGLELLLDESDPLVSFIAQQLGFENVSDLESLPPLPVRTELLDLAQRWYARTDLWQPRLLKLRATVCFTPSHLDMYLAMNDVRLPVRLAGLDINPGWLPWLGRVVAFHYD